MPAEVSPMGSETKTLERRTMHRMAGFAVLTVDWNQRHRSYLDNFINFVLAAMNTPSDEANTSQGITDALFESYGIHLPERVINQILKRAQKFGYVERTDGTMFRTSEKGRNQISALKPRLKNLADEQKDLALTFTNWAKDEFGYVLKGNEASEALMDYIQTYYGSLMSSARGSGSIDTFPPDEPTQLQRLSASFVSWLSKNDPQRFNYTLNIAQGNMLIAALFTPGLIQLDQPFENTTLLLDTKILFRALGYEGPEARIATLEYINLLIQQGASVAAFDFTLKEAKSVLGSALQSLKSGDLWKSRPGSVGAYYFGTNASPGQIDLDMANLETSLGKIGVNIISNPSYEARFVVDEQAIEDKIRSSVPLYRDSALRHDVNALSAIVRMRRGKARESFERCRAVFVTLNPHLLKVAREVQDLCSEPWYVVMYETDVATLSWIKSPPTAPQLPRNMLVATCLGILRPSKTMWVSYVHEMERTYENSTISGNELLLLRQKYEQDQLAFVSTGEPRTKKFDANVAASIRKAREAVTSDIEAPLKKELSDAKFREDQTRSALEEMRLLAEQNREAAQLSAAELAARDAKTISIIKSRSRKHGRYARYGLAILLTIILTLSNLSPDFELFSPKIWDMITKLVLDVLIICGGVFRPGDWFGQKIESLLTNRRLKALGYSTNVD